MVTIGGSWYRPHAINNNGLVVGYEGDGCWPAYSWSEIGGYVELWGPCDFVHAVNDKGQVVGTNVPYYAVSWTKAGGITNLGTGDAVDVNESGQVVGYDRVLKPLPDGTFVMENNAFSWTATGGRIDLGPWEVSALNDNGKVVGHDSQNAYSWTIDGGLVNLGPGEAVDVNKKGQIVGNADFTSGEHAVLWVNKNKRIDLGTLGGTWSRAIEINDVGQIIGISSTKESDTIIHAVLWEPIRGKK